ncbi:MAG: hypothetical protein KDI04_06295 [Halieaceae bacterium]|nr:hypothetical protein [Halieaceae bacterium]
MIAFRKSHPTLARSRFWREDVRWHGTGKDIDMSYESRRLAFYLDGRSQQDADLYVMINADDDDAEFQPQLSSLSGWRRIVDTAAGQDDFCEPEEAPVLTSARIPVRARSIVLLMRPR